MIPKVGDKYRTPGILYEIKAIQILDGDTWVWCETNRKDDVAPDMSSITLKDLLKFTDPVPDFFEEKGEYGLYRYTYTVWHVHKMAHGNVAIAQRTDGTPVILNEDDWGNYKALRRHG